jgi:hypothetical protein
MHPDAESLTAFAEQLLPAPEREEILAHMSTCSRCREVVFLAQQTAEEDQPAPVASADVPAKPRTSWFDWKWAWVPAAACAGIIGLAVLQHSRRQATETQTAANLAATDALQASGSPKAEIRKPATQNELKSPESAKSSGIVAKREEAVPQTRARDEEKGQDANKPADRKDLALSAPAPPPALGGASEGSVRGMMVARAKAAPIGGPSAANQFQQQNMANQQNTLQQSQNALLDAADKKANANVAPRAESETVTVQAQSAIPMQPAPAPAKADATPATEQISVASDSAIAGFSKKQKATLPNGLEELSVASGADRTIALGTNGALFLSEDGGKHWKPVRTQWTGRAVLVRSLDLAEKGKALGALKVSPTAKFELVTDGLQTWVSPDGNIWTLQPMPGK